MYIILTYWPASQHLRFGTFLVLLVIFVKSSLSAIFQMTIWQHCIAAIVGGSPSGGRLLIKTPAARAAAGDEFCFALTHMVPEAIFAATRRL